MTNARHALTLILTPIITLIGCTATDAPTLASDEQGLACVVADTVETTPETSLAPEASVRVALGDDPVFFSNLEIGEPCTQGTIDGRYKSELCFTASATLDDITQCLHDLMEGATLERQAFCEALISNHEVVACDDYDYTATFKYRDESCKLQTRKGRFKHKGCFRLSDDAAVPHPTRCTVIVDRTFRSETLGDVNNCPRCASCNTSNLEL